MIGTQIYSHILYTEVSNATLPREVKHSPLQIIALKKSSKAKMWVATNLIHYIYCADVEECCSVKVIL